MVLDSGRPAVLVNPQAHRAPTGILDRIHEIVPPSDVYLSDDEVAYDDLVAELVDRGYGTVFAAGGDGTVHRLINSLTDTRAVSPRIGILAMGSGNALAGMVGSSDPLADLRRYVDNPSGDTHRLSLCDVEGTHVAFAGFGLDASVLQDFQRVRQSIGRPIRGLRGRSGYLAALWGMTFPRRLFRKRVHVRATNVGSPAQVVTQAEDGARVERVVPSGEVLYEGPANAALLGTSPYFGHHFRLLPLAGIDRQRFHLRLSNVPPVRLLVGLRALRRGTFTHAALYDFLVDRVQLTFSEPVPYHVDGDLKAPRETMTIGMTDKTVELVRFT